MNAVKRNQIYWYQPTASNHHKKYTRLFFYTCSANVFSGNWISLPSAFYCKHDIYVKYFTLKDVSTNIYDTQRMGKEIWYSLSVLLKYTLLLLKQNKICQNFLKSYRGPCSLFINKIHSVEKIVTDKYQVHVSYPDGAFYLISYVFTVRICDGV